MIIGAANGRTVVSNTFTKKVVTIYLQLQGSGYRRSGPGSGVLVQIGTARRKRHMQNCLDQIPFNDEKGGDSMQLNLSIKNMSRGVQHIYGHVHIYLCPSMWISVHLLKRISIHTPIDIEIYPAYIYLSAYIVNTYLSIYRPHRACKWIDAHACAHRL